MPIRADWSGPCFRTLIIKMSVPEFSLRSKILTYLVSNTWQQFRIRSLWQVRFLLLRMQRMVHNWRPCNQLLPCK